VAGKFYPVYPFQYFRYPGQANMRKIRENKMNYCRLEQDTPKISANRSFKSDSLNKIVGLWIGLNAIITLIYLRSSLCLELAFRVRINYLLFISAKNLCNNLFTN